MVIVIFSDAGVYSTTCQRSHHPDPAGGPAVIVNLPSEPLGAPFKMPSSINRQALAQASRAELSPEMGFQSQK